MSKPPGVNVTGTIVPSDTADSYPVIDPVYGVDGRRTLATLTARNAIPSGLRREGMEVYTKSDQNVYVLRPMPSGGWAMDNTDWVLDGSLQPFVAPTFTSFVIAGQPISVVTGTTISGSVTFNWSTSLASEIAANSITINDTTNNVVLASGLSNSGSEPLTLPTPITHAGVASQVWTISGTDVKGNPFFLNFTVSWLPPPNLTYWVRPDGNDSHTGLSDTSGAAFLTIQHAVSLMVAGNECIVTAGTYAGAAFGLSGAQNGTLNQPIVLMGQPGAIINEPSSSHGAGINSELCNYITIQGFTINGGSPASAITGAGIRCVGDFNGVTGINILGNTVTNVAAGGGAPGGIFTSFLSNSAIQGNNVSFTQATGTTQGHGIYASNSGTNVAITGNIGHDVTGSIIHTNGDVSLGGIGLQSGFTITGNIGYNGGTTHAATAINCDGLQDSVLSNNLMYNCSGGGLALFQQDAAFPSIGNQVTNNTFVLLPGTDRFCINLSNNAANNTITNNILDNRDTGGVVGAITADLGSLIGLNSDYNVMGDVFNVNNTVYSQLLWRAITGGDHHSLFLPDENLLFVNPGVNDYHLLPGSVAIDAGTNTNAPIIDLDGNPRPVNNITDIGCYEYDVSRPSVVAWLKTPQTLGACTALEFVFSLNIGTGGLVIAVTDGLGDPVTGTFAYNSSTFTVTWTPGSSIAGGQTILVNISGATANGKTMVPSVHSFALLAAIASVQSFFTDSTVPTTPDGGDTVNVNFLGIEFSSSADGLIYGIKFYKAPANLGQHYISLWIGTSLIQTLLVNPVGETSHGWQAFLFDSPIGITAGVTYIASYLSQRDYAADFGYFASSALTVGDLTAPQDGVGGANNGVFSSGAGDPTEWTSFNSANYYVDVLFVPGDVTYSGTLFRLLSDALTPATIDSGDASDVTVGTVFKSDNAGHVTKISFYKAAANTGLHIGKIWDMAGSLLATVPFNSETSSGWQHQTLVAPVAVSAATDYVVSVHCPNGHYSINNNFFGVQYDNAEMHGPASGAVTDGNGRFAAGDAFPNGAFQASLYWVDMEVTVPLPATVIVTSHVPTASASGVSPTAPITMAFNQDVNPSSIVFALSDGSGSIAGTGSYNSGTLTYTFTPTSALPNSDSVTARLTVANAEVGGAVLAGTVSWTFTTAAAATPHRLWTDGTTPSTTDFSDSAAYMMGIVFHVDANTFVTKSKFYKGTGNTGTHVGTLYRVSDAAVLGAVTFTGETSSGWQSATFASPIAILAYDTTSATEYMMVVSMPNGNYALNSGYFATGYDNAPLHVLADPAATYFKQTAIQQQPDTHSSANFWVDVEVAG
jgi:hypothetical protein